MVLAYHGTVIPEDQVAEACGTTHVGTYPNGAVKAAQQFGFGATSNRPLTFRTLREKVATGLLPITYIYRRAATPRVAHAVVVYEITGEADDDVVRFTDPALEEPGEDELPVAEFKTSWTSAGTVTIIVGK
jgi:ABC-type bacteriocin/lantibiotic exporter with double-glycine peptidase domain